MRLKKLKSVSLTKQACCSLPVVPDASPGCFPLVSVVSLTSAAFSQDFSGDYVKLD